jgi:hypothetical protein
LVDAEDLHRRQIRDLENAKERQKRVNEKLEESKPRAEKISMLECAKVEAKRDPNRLLTLTKASKTHLMTCDDLDAADRRRSREGAHGRLVASSHFDGDNTTLTSLRLD